MAIYDYTARLLEEKEELIIKKMEKNGLVVDNVIVLNQDYDFIKGGCVIRAEKGSVGIIRDVIIDGIDENGNAKCTLPMYFYASDYYLSLNFTTTENNDSEIAIEGKQINIKDLLTVLDESNEIAQAVKQYEELENALFKDTIRYDNSINLWKVLRVLWIAAIVFSFMFIARNTPWKDIPIPYFVFSVLVMLILATVAILFIIGITAVDYSDTSIGKKKEKELEAALEAIEELDKKSCGERKC